MDSMIITAIEKHQLLSFTYEGFYRVVEPYCYGMTGNGIYCFRAFQVGGESSLSIFGWKYYAVSKAVNLQVTGQIFLPNRKGYSREDNLISKIIIEV
jgi:hypothetical protein